ncbi:prepilin peptidase [Thiohalorhabdus sp. Cl-TMA]|uniref:A24 family peptidase n=1 Tax=Thiohalorhabdus methylotrophus TaxID=3242694 RepID=A0ABV4TTC8_9GAMM
MIPSSAMLLVAAGVLGLIVGSFLNVVAHRLPRDRSIVRPASSCPSCGHRIGALENIPLLSYLALRGRCRGCGATIPPGYPLTELTSAILTALTVWVVGASWTLVPALVFTWMLMVLTRIDLELQLLPDRLTLPLGGLGLLYAGGAAYLPMPPVAPTAAGAPASPLAALLGAALGYGLLFLAGWGYERATGREGMGGGDLKLLGALGAWVGPVAVLLALFLAALMGSLIGGLLILLRGGDRHLAIPFGPFLAAGGWALFLWKDTIIRWYFGLSGSLG